MIRIDTAAEPDQALVAAAAALRRGQLVVLPLDTTYGLAADAFDRRGTEALRTAKARADLAIPVMVPTIATVSGIAVVSAAARELMRDFWPGPLTLVLPAQPSLAWSITDSAGRVAVRMPLHPVALALLTRTGPLGVVAGAPAPGPPAGPRTADDAVAGGLAEHVSVLLDAGPLPAGPASAVVDLTRGSPVLVRPGPLDPADLLASCPELVVPSPGPGPAAT